MWGIPYTDGVMMRSSHIHHSGEIKLERAHNPLSVLNESYCCAMWFIRVIPFICRVEKNPLLTGSGDDHGKKHTQKEASMMSRKMIFSLLTKIYIDNVDHRQRWSRLQRAFLAPDNGEHFLRRRRPELTIDEREQKRCVLHQPVQLASSQQKNHQALTLRNSIDDPRLAITLL